MSEIIQLPCKEPGCSLFVDYLPKTTIVVGKKQLETPKQVVIYLPCPVNHLNRYVIDRGGSA
jgi:hypothetical protein